MWDYVEEQALKYTCSYCLAPPGIYCRTYRGAVATALHNGRVDPLRLAWLHGWGEGMKEANARDERMKASA